ncbi:hypothetical protein ACI1US_02291 [Leucobacter sp. BZR 635]
MTTSFRARIGALSTVLLLGGSLCAATPAIAAPAPAAATTIEVTSGENAGPGTLREAFDTANATPETATTITFAASVTTVTVTEALQSGVALTVQGNGQDNTELKFAPASPEEYFLLGFEGAALQLDGVTLTGDGQSDATGVLIGYADSHVGASSVTNTTITGFNDRGVAIEGVTDNDFTMTGSTLSSNGVGLGAWSFKDAAFTVTDSVFEHNFATAFELHGFTPGTGPGARIERVRFADNGELVEEDWGPQTGALSLGGDFATAGEGVIPVSIVDSTFENNVGVAVGAIDYQPEWGEESMSAEPRVLVSGSTFSGNIGGEFKESYDARAAGILLSSPPMLRAADDAADDAPDTTPLVLRVENSTFDGSAAAADNKSSAFITEAYGSAGIELDQVTAVASTIDLIGKGPEDRLAIARSAIDSGGSDPLTPRTEEDLAPHVITVTDSVFTSPSASADLESGSSQVLPLAALELGPLADNGGPTATMLPTDSSPLVDAVTEAGPLSTDQRGLPRPANGNADIGAVEVQEALLPAESSVGVVADVTVANGETAVFAIERSVTDTDRELPEASVRISTSDGTAIAGTDYTASEATVHWAAGESGAKTFSVPTTKRSGELAARSFTVTLSDPSEGLTITRESAAAILPAVDATVTPPPTPPVPEVTPDPDGEVTPPDIAHTGGIGLLPWILVAGVSTLAGAGLIALRRRGRA